MLASGDFHPPSSAFAVVDHPNSAHIVPDLVPGHFLGERRKLPGFGTNSCVGLQFHSPVKFIENGHAAEADNKPAFGRLIVMRPNGIELDTGFAGLEALFDGVPQCVFQQGISCRTGKRGHIAETAEISHSLIDSPIIPYQFINARLKLFTADLFVILEQRAFQKRRFISIAGFLT